MYEVFTDLHVHIGRSEKNHPIKITAARSLNFANIAKECKERKGIGVVGIIDCMSPYIIEDIENFLRAGEAYEVEDGGIIYKDEVCILLGAEIETSEMRDDGKKGSAHNICFFPHLKDIKRFSNEMKKYINNITLSSQRTRLSAYDLVDIVEECNGILIPAHCFTPHKSFYGNCTDRLQKIFKEKYGKIYAIELGLSSDTFLADSISELEQKSFITNSDAHSLPKIAREYNKLLVGDISYKEVIKALKNEDGRKVVANYGLDPKLGKYHRTYCEKCEKNVSGKSPVTSCNTCDSSNITVGVLDRIEMIRDKEIKCDSYASSNRPPYVYQIPLSFIPGLGKKTIEKLLDVFETEMNILHKVSVDDLEGIVGKKIADNIIRARSGNMKIQEGGGRSVRKTYIENEKGKYMKELLDVLDENGFMTGEI
ncbi:MAG: endonuclease Q family protein [Oscillospiraceae bacterium]|nr:endonuclease Q family protein [Oscillospiraceae bacterium]